MFLVVGVYNELYTIPGSGTVDGQNGWLWTGVTLVACSMRWLERPPGPAVAGWVLGCDGQRFRWPETLQPFKHLSRASVGAHPIPPVRICSSLYT